MKDRNMYYTNINSVFNERRSDWVNKCEMLKFIESRVAAYQIKGYQVYITKKKHNENIDNCIWKGHQVQKGSYVQ